MDYVVEGVRLRDRSKKTLREVVEMAQTVVNKES